MSELTDLRCFCSICGGRVAFPADASGTMAACPHCNAQMLLKMSPEAMAEDGIILPGDDAPLPTKSAFKAAGRPAFAVDDLVACRECGAVASSSKMSSWGDEEWICFECQPPPRPKASAELQTEAQPAGMGLRAFAKLIDLVIVGILVAAVAFFFSTWTSRVAVALGGWSFLPKVAWLLKTLAAGMIAYPLIFAYQTAFVALKGGTPGKLFCEIEVIDSNGDTPTWGRAALRFLSETVLAVTLNILFFQANYIIAAFDAQKRTYHDVIAKTWVVMNRNPKKQTYF